MAAMATRMAQSNNELGILMDALIQGCLAAQMQGIPPDASGYGTRWSGIANAHIQEVMDKLVIAEAKCTEVSEAYMRLKIDLERLEKKDPPKGAKIREGAAKEAQAKRHGGGVGRVGW